MIEVNGLCKHFAQVNAVQDLSFTVHRGEIFGIVGPDGAGKSTLMRLIAGILTPHKGSITIDGIDVGNNLYRIKENLAYMPQRFGLYDDLTVEENIFFFGRLFGVSSSNIKKKSELLYGFSKLGPFRKRLAGNLSGGMKQKLGLACCLVHSPKLILLDEPTNGVDPVSRREFWKILYDLLSDGVTIVVSTAYLDEAERCNRVSLMHEGTFPVIGSPAEIKKSMQRVLIEIRTDNVWFAETVMRKTSDCGSVIREGNNLRIFVNNYRKDSARLRSYLETRGVNVTSVTRMVPTLENCFMEIMLEGDS